MRRAVALLLVAGCCSWTLQAERTKKSAVQKVVEMLEEYKAKIATDLAGEEKEMAEYANYCDDESSARGYAIKTATRKIEDLNAALSDGAAQTQGADSDIASLGTEMSGKDQDLAALEKQRGTEKTDFEATEKELAASVEQVEKSLVLVKRAGVGLLQKMDSSKKPIQAKLLRDVSQVLGRIVDAGSVASGASSSKMVKGFLQQKDGEDLSAALARKAAEEPAEEGDGGGGLVQTLEDMKAKAEEALSAARTNEMKSNHNYQMLKQNVVNALTTFKEKLGSAKDLKAGVAQAMGEAEGELSVQKKTKLADQMFVDSLKHDCQKAAEAWDARQQGAKDEMGAIDKAAGILEERVKSLFVQGNDDYITGSDGGAVGDQSSPVRASLVAKLKDMGHRFNSYALAELAGAATQDPFAKVRALITDMIAKLTAEANEEATQQAFCDEEKAKSSKDKEKKSMRADELQNRVDTATTTVAKLEESVKELEAEVAEIDKGSKEASKIRAEEQATNMKASEEFKEGAAAVEEAVRVLRDFYASALLVQVNGLAHRQPKLGGAKTDAAGVIISILENIGEEFTKSYMEIQMDEQDAADGYKKSMEESKASKAAKLAAAKAAESEVKGLKVSIQENGEDLKMASKELEAVLTYIEKLRPQCETKVMSYAEKKARRQAEIDGLKEAMAILDEQ